MGQRGGDAAAAGSVIDDDASAGGAPPDAPVLVRQRQVPEERCVIAAVFVSGSAGRRVCLYRGGGRRVRGQAGPLLRPPSLSGHAASVNRGTGGRQRRPRRKGRPSLML